MIAKVQFYSNFTIKMHFNSHMDLCSVYQKLYPLKFELSASYCINLTALNASN